MKTKIIVAALFVFTSSIAFGQSKQEISKALDAVGASGHFSQAQVEEAKKQLNNMSDEDMRKLIQMGNKMKNDPRIRKSLKEMGMENGFGQ